MKQFHLSICMCVCVRNPVIRLTGKEREGEKEGARSSAIELAQRLKYERTNKQAYGGGMRRSEKGGEKRGEKERTDKRDRVCA